MRFVIRHGDLETAHGGDDDRVHAFFVDGHLDGDFGRDEAVCVGSSEAGLVGGKVSRVAAHAADGADDLKEVGEDDLEEEQGDTHEEGDGNN